ncbi:MAG TPA: RHS repeat-associated core domain-containing protein [Candidatus Xenobia bacterium]|nr:RHS repeat-associated core domain-containing protein [Candidatus Xenobia bacterium]
MVSGTRGRRFESSQARYDASTLGRFMSPDSPAFSLAHDPQSWNLYAYVTNNPLRYIDPTGHVFGPPACCRGSDEWRVPTNESWALGNALGDPELNWVNEPAHFVSGNSDFVYANSADEVTPPYAGLTAGQQNRLGTQVANVLCNEFCGYRLTSENRGPGDLQDFRNMLRAAAHVVINRWAAGVNGGVGGALGDELSAGMKRAITTDRQARFIYRQMKVEARDAIVVHPAKTGQPIWV